MMPQGQVYTFPQQGAVSMSYHIVGPTQQYQHTAAPAPGQQRPAQVMNNAAAPFQPGGQYPGGPQQVGVAGPYGGGPHLGGQNIIYSHGGAPGGGQVGHPGQVQMGMYGQPRYMMPHGQHMQPGHHLAMQQVPLSQAPPSSPILLTCLKMLSSIVRGEASAPVSCAPGDLMTSEGPPDPMGRIVVSGWLRSAK